MINEHELVKVNYLQLILQVRDRVLQAFQSLLAQARAIWAIRIVPGFDKPGHVAQFGATRCTQLWQHFAAQPGTSNFLLQHLMALKVRG